MVMENVHFYLYLCGYNLRESLDSFFSDDEAISWFKGLEACSWIRFAGLYLQNEGLDDFFLTFNTCWLLLVGKTEGRSSSELSSSLAKLDLNLLIKFWVRVRSSLYLVSSTRLASIRVEFELSMSSSPINYKIDHNLYTLRWKVKHYESFYF